MKRITIAAVGLCVLAAATVAAQTADKKAVETTTKQTLPGVTLKTETQSVSGTVKDLVVGSGLSFLERGSRVLKGVEGECRLFAAT